MKQYDVIAVGTGSVMAVVEAMIEGNPRVQIAVIDKDEPGGICLTRGCIPSKILLYPADLVRTIERAGHFGLDVELRSIDFVKVMERMHSLIHKDIDQIRKGLSSSENLDYFHAPAEFTAPYTMRVDGTEIHGSKILLGAGSEPIIPEIPGLAEAGYLTSDTVLRIRKLPPRVAVIGGGYIAAEYGFFLAAMGADVTILGRNPQFLPEEEPEGGLPCGPACRVHRPRGRERRPEGSGGNQAVRGRECPDRLLPVPRYREGRGDGREGLLRQGPGRTRGTRGPGRPHRRTGGVRPHSGDHQSHVHEGPERGPFARRHAYPSGAERSRGTSLLEPDAAGALPPHDGARARHSFTLA